MTNWTHMSITIHQICHVDPTGHECHLYVSLADHGMITQLQFCECNPKMWIYEMCTKFCRFVTSAQNIGSAVYTQS
jgi:hypothetical protein